MCDQRGVRATAAAIPDAGFVLMEGMAQDLPRPLWPRMADLIAATVQRGESMAQVAAK